MLEALLGEARVEPLHAAVAALRAGAGVDRLLDVVVAAVSERMLRYEPSGEFDFHDDFGWLDITHGITYANAVRWHHAHLPGPDAVRLALWCVFQANWTGRHEWHAGVGRRADIEPRSDDLTTYGEALQREALLDGTTAFIVHAHAVKTSVAATEEAVRSGSPAPLDAVARFMAEPRLERFVAAHRDALDRLPERQGPAGGLSADPLPSTQEAGTHQLGAAEGPGPVEASSEPSPSTTGVFTPSDRVGALLLRADADEPVDVGDPHLAVADLAGRRGADDDCRRHARRRRRRR